MSKRRSQAIDLVEENTLNGRRTNVSREYGKVIRIRMPSTKTMTVSILGSRGAVGTAGRGAEPGGSLSVGVLILDGVGDFLH